MNSGPTAEQQLLNELDELYPRIERSIRAYTAGTGLDARDLTQDVFLKAVKNLDQFNKTSTLYTWLYRIARNTSIDAMRRLKTRRRFDATDVDTELQPDDTGEAGSEFAPVYEKLEERELVHRVMASMPEEYRELIILKDFEDLQYNEIAALKGIREGTVKSRLFRARTMLKTGLTKAGYTYES